jgi:hypothetical protein
VKILEGENGLSGEESGLVFVEAVLFLLLEVLVASTP